MVNLCVCNLYFSGGISSLIITSCWFGNSDRILAISWMGLIGNAVPTVLKKYFHFPWIPADLKFEMMHSSAKVKWDCLFAYVWSKMYLFQEVGKPELGFPNHEFIQLWARTSARRARVLPITVWTSGWENQFRFPKFLEEAFSDISVISQ